MLLNRDVFVVQQPGDPADDVSVLSLSLHQAGFSVLRSLPASKLLSLSNHQLEESMLSCSAVILILSQNLFERDKRAKQQAFIVRKYVKLEITEKELGGPMVQPVYNLPRLLRRFQRLSKPLIALSTTGSPPPPPSGLSDLLDSTKSIIQVSTIDEAIKALQDQGVTPTEMDDSATSTSLVTCSSCQSLQSENASLQARLSCLEEKGECGNTPLITAAKSGHESIVKALLGAGANKDAQADGGETALIVAADWAREGCVRLLVEAGADRSIKDKFQRIALSCGRTEAIKTILKQ